MQSLVAMYESLGAGVTYDTLNAVADQSVTISSNNRFLFPTRRRVLGASVMGVNITAARLNWPSLRQFVLPEVYPTNPAAAIGDDPQWIDYVGRGPFIEREEEVSIDVSHGGAGAEDVLAGLWTEDVPTPAPSGPVYTLTAAVTGAGTVTLTVGTWVNAAITFNQTLPTGWYEVVGLQVICNDAFLARLVFPGINAYRPGCLVSDTYGQSQRTQPFRMGAMGSWGRFRSTAQPSVDFLGYAAGAETPVILIDVVPVAGP